MYTISGKGNTVNAIMQESTCLGQIKKTPVFRVTLPYLNLLALSRMFSVFLGKYNFMHFERQSTFQNAYKNPEKNYLKFSDHLPETHFFFIWPYIQSTNAISGTKINADTIKHV